MRIVHISYNQLNIPDFDAAALLRKFYFSIGVWECMAQHADVIAFYHPRHDAMIKKNGITHYFTSYDKAELLFPFSLNSRIKKLCPEVVMVHGLSFPLQVILLGWQLGKGVRIIAQHHAEKPFAGIRGYLQRLADHHIEKYLFTSANLGKLWVERGQVGGMKKIAEVMEASSSFSYIDKQEARIVTHVQGHRTFIWVGRLDTNKDPLVAAKAFIRFAREHNDVKLYMIYQTYELLDALQALVDHTGASSVVHLIGKVPHEELQFWFSSCDFVISTSHYEGGSIAVCEGMSCGCIPIVTDIASFDAMTDHGNIGLLYKAGDEDALVKTLQQGMAMNIDDEKQRVLDHFHSTLSFESISNKILAVIGER